jgi:Domain of unknown function (DUF5615)
MPKRFYKHKVLLDENMPHRTDLPLLNSKFDVKHLIDDLNQGSLPDPQVYQLAVVQQRILVTSNPRSRGLSEHGAFFCEECCIPAHMQGWRYPWEEDFGKKCR